MVDSRVAVTSQDVAALTDHRLHRELAHLPMEPTTLATSLTAGKPAIDLHDPSPSPICLVVTERDEPGHTGIGDGKSKVPVPAHALHVQRFKLQYTGLGCQSVRNLMQQVLPAFANLSMNSTNAPRLGTASGRSLPSSRQGALCASQPLLCLSQMLRRGDFLERAAVKRGNESSDAQIHADRDIARRQRLGAVALELCRDHPAIAVAPDTSRQQTPFRYVAAAKSDSSNLRNVRLAIRDLGCLPDAIDTAFVDELLFDPGKAALLDRPCVPSPCAAGRHPFGLRYRARHEQEGPPAMPSQAGASW